MPWLESVQEEDGSLGNPTTLDRHPSAPWWTEWGGQRVPESIVGNLARLGLATPRLLDRSRAWVEANVTLDAIRETEWLFMLYRPVDYFYGLTDDNDLDAYREVTAGNAGGVGRSRPAGTVRHPAGSAHPPGPGSACARTADRPRPSTTSSGVSSPAATGRISIS